MKYKYIQIISIFFLFIFLLNFISAFENNLKEEEAKYYQDVFYPPEEILAKQGMTLESYIQSLKATAPKNRNSSVDNIWGTSPLTGTIKIPVLLVKFSNTTGTQTSRATIDTKFNSPTIAQSSISVKKYFNMQSYGALDVNFVVYDWIPLSNSSGYYDDNSEMNSQLMRDAMNAFVPSVDFAQFDSDDNNRIDGIIIIYAGNNLTGIPAQTKINKNLFGNQYDNKYLGNAAIVSEKYNNNSDYIDVIAHEFAHVLGLPDLYENSPTFSNPGPMKNMSMMTSNHTGDSTCRKKPSNLDAWSRYFFGWTNPMILTTDSNKTTSLGSANDYPEAVILKNSNMGSREFFIIENRYRTNNTSPYTNLDYCMFNHLSSTTGGFAIYHVDENKIEYDYPNNYVNWDRDGNYYDDTINHPGVLYEKNKVSSLITFDTEPLDLYYFDSGVLGREKFDENFHIVLPNEIWDMTSRSYNGNLNPLIRFQAISSTNQPEMAAKMLVGEETITPTATPDPAIVYNAPTLITITSQTLDANIYYTIDGSTPTTASPVYSSPFYINSNTTLKAIAKKDNFYVSDVLTVNYTVNATVATPTSSIPSGDINYNSLVSLSTTTSGSTIRYTLDGSDPTESSTVYTTPITISQSLILKARAYKDNWLPSAIATYDYRVLTVDSPQSDPLPRDHIYNTPITLFTTTENAQIYYTMDGTTPSDSSTLYVNPIILDHNLTLKAIAYRDGYAPSAVATFIYTTTIPTNRILNITFLETEIINKIEDRNNIYLLVPHNADRRTLTPTITIEPGATITPQENGIPQDFTRPRHYTVTSVTGSKNYIISVFNDILVTPPRATPARGTYGSPQTVTLISGMPRFSTIRYTINGEDPLNSPSQNYTTPITISEDTTLKARTFYRTLPVTSTNTATSDNSDYHYNQIYLKLFKKEYVSELMVEEYIIEDTLKSEVQEIEITE